MPSLNIQQLASRHFMKSKDIARGAFFLKTTGDHASKLDKKYQLDFEVMRKMPIREQRQIFKMLAERVNAGKLKNRFRHQALDFGIDKSILQSLYGRRSPNNLADIPTEAGTSDRLNPRDLDLANADFSRDALFMSKQHQILSMSPAHLYAQGSHPSNLPRTSQDGPVVGGYKRSLDTKKQIYGGGSEIGRHHNGVPIQVTTPEDKYRKRLLALQKYESGELKRAHQITSHKQSIGFGGGSTKVGEDDSPDQHRSMFTDGSAAKTGAHELQLNRLAALSNESSIPKEFDQNITTSQEREPRRFQ